MPNFDQSTWLAYRAISAEQMGPPKLPGMLALPGAKVAIPHDRLLAHQQAGHSQEQIVARVNAKWEQENAAVVDEQARWVAGPYADAVVQMRRAAAEKAAGELRKKAVFEQILAERDARNA